MVAASAQPLLACDLCSIYPAPQAQGQIRSGLFAGVAEQFTGFGTLQHEGQEITGEGQYIDSSVAQVFAGYNFAKKRFTRHRIRHWRLVAGWNFHRLRKTR